MMRRLVLILWSLFAGAAFAADEVVSNCGTDAELRSKLAAMQASGGGTLTFACGAGPTVIVLNGTPLPAIQVATTVDGGGTISLSGGNATRHFTVTGALTLRRLRLERGYTTEGSGGSVSGTTLSIDRCIFSDNQSAGGFGGAIRVIDSLTVDDSEFLRNRAGAGGAIYAGLLESSVIVRDSRFIENEATNPFAATAFGGAIMLANGTAATVERSSFIGNKGIKGRAIHVAPNASATLFGIGVVGTSEQFGTGSAIFNEGVLDLSESQLFGPSNVGLDLRAGSSAVVSRVVVSRFGFAVANESSQTSLSDVTLSGNSVGFRNSAAATLRHCTVAGNATRGIETETAIPNMAFVSNTVFADNGTNCDTIVSITSAGFNLSDDGTCQTRLGQPGDRNSIDARLQPLSDLGTTYGHLPHADSPLVDGAGAANCSALDQRGLPRPVGAACDIGAIERQAVEAPLVLFGDGFE